MKKIFALVLLFALVLNHMGRLVVYLNYVAYKSEITQKYCKNKQKPKLHCDGKCHLKKQLKKADNAQTNPLKSEQKETNEILFFANGITLNLLVRNNLNSVNIKHKENVSVVFTDVVYSPPKYLI